jgi:hypothetical protein
VTQALAKRYAAALTSGTVTDAEGARRSTMSCSSALKDACLPPQKDFRATSAVSPGQVPRAMKKRLS